jgi:uncharacterized OsmC-like protein
MSLRLPERGLPLRLIAVRASLDHPASRSEIVQNRELIKNALERNARVVQARPAVGQGTAVTKVRWRHGLTCDVEDGPWTFAVGMTDKYGGDNSAPNPGVYGRAALGSCLAIGYAIWAARMNVPFRSLDVEVQADYDVRGELGVDDSVRPGYSEMRVLVTIESDAPESEVLAMLDVAERHSSYLDDFRNPVPVKRELRLVPSPAA